MRAASLNVGLFVTFFSLGAAASEPSNPSGERTGKHFSLFSVVTFKNEECTSDASLNGGARAGTCYSTTECSDKAGMKSGNCASGFGVCCIFLENSGATATVSENRTWIRNAEFPAVSASATALAITYTLQKMSADICQIRLDFEVFVIAGPGNTQEIVAGATTMTHCTNDALVFTQSGGFRVPTICGSNTGEHLYIDLGALATDTATLALTTSTTVTAANAARAWDIKTSQIECWANYRAPEGCHRYLTSDSGKIASLNFRQETNPAIVGATNVGGNTGLELSGQDLNTCIRRSKGMCCVEYLVCTSFNSIALATDTAGTIGVITGTQAVYTDGWKIDVNSFPMGIALTTVNSGMVDAMCSSDYVEIPSSYSGACGPNGSGRGSINTRYCGAKFGANLQRALPVVAITGGTMHTPVCDCSEPFLVSHHADIYSDLGGTANVNTAGLLPQALVVNRGFCLDFTQQTCAY